MPVKQVWKETWRRVNDDRICTAQSNTAVLGHLFGTGTNYFCKFTASDKKAISENVLFYQCMCRNWHRTLERRSRWAPWQWIYSHDVHSLTEWKGTVCKQLIIHLFAETRVLTDLTATVKQHVQILNQMIFNVNFSLAFSKAWEYIQSDGCKPGFPFQSGSVCFQTTL